MSNQQRTWLALVGLSAFTISLGYHFGGRDGLIWCAALSLSVTFLIYFYGDKLIHEQVSGQPLNGQDPWGLNALNQKLSKTSFITPSRLVLISDETPQAFVAGRNRNSGTIYITLSLLKSLNAKEREALMAYLITCLSQNMTFSYTFLTCLISASLFVSQVGDHLIRWLLGSRKKANQSLQNHICTLATLPLLSSAVRLLSPPSSYLRVDQVASQLIEDKKILAHVLWKLQSYNSTIPMEPHLNLSHMFIVNPLTNTIWNRYFQPHPSVAHRIRQLTGQYPI